MIVSVTTGTGSSPSLTEQHGVITRPKGGMTAVRERRVGKWAKEGQQVSLNWKARQQCCWQHRAKLQELDERPKELDKYGLKWEWRAGDASEGVKQ
jgi:hypothetical protein